MVALAVDMDQLLTFVEKGPYRRWIWNPFMTPPLAHLDTEGLTGVIILGGLHWVKGVMFGWIGYTLLAGKGDLAFELMLLPPRVGCPLHLLCVRQKAMRMT
jgi:hypothetical protein